jgi:hypothetical protein
MGLFYQLLTMNGRINKMIIGKEKSKYEYYVSGYYLSPSFYLKHRPVFTQKHNVSENAFCLRCM